MNKKFTKLMAAIALLVFMTPSMVGWGQSTSTYTISLLDNGTGSDGSSTIGYITNANVPNYVSITGGSGYVSSISTGYTYQASANNGWKLSSGSGYGTVTLNLTTAAQALTVSKVTINAKNYGTDATTLTVTVTKTDNTTQIQSFSDLGSDFTDYDLTLTSASTIKSINIAANAKSKRAYVHHVTVTYYSGDVTYAVTYKANEGIGDDLVDNNGGDGYANGVDVTVKDNEGTGNPNFTRTGYSFTNWNTAANGSGTSYSAGNTFPISSNTNLFAQWTANTHSITVSGNDHGTVTGYTNPIAYGTEVTLVYAHNDGEYYSATFSSTDVTITDGTFTMPDNAVTITVTETALPVYTVTFSDGGSETEAHYGAGVTLPNRSGDGTYTFAGWTTSNIASETAIAPEPILTGTYYPTNDITLYPVYTRTEGSGYKWQKITDLSTVTDGIYALLTTDGHAFNGTISSGHGGVTETAFSFTNNEATAAPEGTCEITMVSVTGGYKMYNSSQGYLYAKAASSKNLAWHDSENSYWFYGNNNWKYNSNGAYLRSYENGSFRTYGSNSGDVMVMAKKVSNSITYYVSSLTFVAVPTFNPTSQNFSTASLSVTISAESGCVIRYTTDNWEHEIETPSNTITIELSGTTTVKAMAKNGSDLSAEVSETYTRVYSVALISNGVEKSIEEVVPTESISLSAPDNVPQGFTFMGWTADPSTPNTLVNTEYTPTGNVTLYASFAKIISSSYDIVTSASNMTEGEYIIATYYGSKYYTIKSNTAVSSNPAAYEQAVTDNAITGDVTELTWSFSGTSSAMVIKSTSQNLYLNTTNTAQGVKINTTDDDSWTISYNSTDNYFSMKSTNGGGNRYLSVFISSGSPQDWRNYSSGTTNSFQQITLFKKNAIVSTDCYIRVFQNETATAAIEIAGPSIIPSGSTLNMSTYALSNSDAANLIIEDGGQLVTSSSNVQATVQKNIAAHGANAQEGGWNFIATPIVNGTTPSTTNGILSSTENDYDLFFYDEPTHYWRNYKNNNGNTSPEFDLRNGQGYLYANAADTRIEFTGTLRPSNAEYTVNSLSYTSGIELAGFNLVGNPFACNATVDRACYIIQDGVIVATNGTVAAPCSGVMVQATTTGQSVTFTPTTDAAVFSTGHNQLNVTIANNMTARGEGSMIDNAIVSFNENSQLEKFVFFEDNAKLYIPQGEKDYAIVSAEAQGEMPVCFKAIKDGEYTITVSPEGVELNYLHLIDNMTGMDVDLLQTPSYTFEASTRDYESRFKLVFAGASTDSATDEFFAYYDGSEWKVSNEGEATLQVVDVIGRIVKSETINGNFNLNLNQKAGVYMLRLINGENVKVQKVVVR